MAYLGACRKPRIVLVLLAFACTAGVFVAPVTARAAPPLTRGITDDVWFDGGGEQWVPRTVATGARVALIELDWRTAEPNAPRPGIDPADPNGPEYSFAVLDSRIREIASSGLSVALVVGGAPRWAEAGGGPSNLEATGAWRPSPQAYGQFATALARRYSGSYPDPLNPGQTLPRVRYFQAWAEANLSVHLAPQWTVSGRTLVPTGPIMYRSLLNAFYVGIKSAHPDNFVITTGLAPYGDPPGQCRGTTGVGNGCRMRPAMFTRALLCLGGQSLRAAACPNPAHFDAMAADPYEVGSPVTPAFNIDDVSAPDLGKLTRIVNRAVALGRALPRRHKQLWVTEFGYDSNPPNPTAVSLATQARWLDEALYLFWSQGVNTAVWYLVRDQAPTYNPFDYYTGLYFYNGQAKPSFEAYRFPLVVWSTGGALQVWGIAPRTGSLAFQHKAGRGWKTLFRVRASAGGVFIGRISARFRGSFRGVIGDESSLIWKR